MQRAILLVSLSILAGCGSISVPAAVKTSDGRVLTGTAIASASGGTFSVRQPGTNLSCSGSYNAFDTSPTISAPVTCNDGRYGTLTVTRTPDMQSGSGVASLSDGTNARVTFGSLAASVLDPNTAPTYAALGSTGDSGSKIYTGNCPTPESLDAAGHRCGARSAVSRPGGYDGYGSWASTTPSYSRGSTYVRGYYRKNGTYVQSHYRRR